eukprot:jgi/Botrbrau1/23467/Bobra.106_1s0022.1
MQMSHQTLPKGDRWKWYDMGGKVVQTRHGLLLMSCCRHGQGPGHQTIRALAQWSSSPQPSVFRDIPNETYQIQTDSVCSNNGKKRNSFRP